MAGETSSVIPLQEAPSPRGPLHLRYVSLLRTNPSFRRLWGAQLISEIGDWFYSLAVYDLLLKLTGSGKAVGWAIIIQLLPWFFMTPLAGFLADRFLRRQLMIVADVVRGCVVVGLLLVQDASDVWLVYVLLGVEVVFASIFEPARNALLPNLVLPKDVLSANALSSATWSLALTVGAALGGAVTALLGRQVAFLTNSASFFLSAILICRIQIQEAHLFPMPHDPSDRPRSSSVESLREGWEYLRQNPKVLVLVMAKTGLGCVGGVLLLLAVFGERVFPVAGHGALAMGLLYGARGVGAGLGPLIGDHLTRGSQRQMWQGIGLSFLIMGASYLAFSGATNLPLAALAVLVAHMGGSNIWVASTALLQLNVADRFRGRVFALDFGMNMLVASVSNYAVGAGLDSGRWTARQLAAGLGLVLMIPFLLWWPAQRKWGRKSAPSDH
jgi:predicted MFS family arabinose efflux permease